MSKDNYLEFDKQLLEISVYRLQRGLADLTPYEKEKLLNSEQYVFAGPNASKDKKQQVQSRIYLSDTIGDILHKIAGAIPKSSYTGADIFAWLSLNKGDISSFFLQSYPLSVYHENSNGISNPFQEKTYDDNFVTEGGISKQDPQLTMRNSTKLLSEVLEELSTSISEVKIYFTTIDDYFEWSSNEEFRAKLSDEQFFHGIIRKYWPGCLSLRSLVEPSKREKAMMGQRRKAAEKIVETLTSQKAIQEEHSDLNLSLEKCVPMLLVYQNKIDSENSLNLYKIFKDFELSIDVPFLRLYTDNYLDSLVKMYKPSLNTSYSAKPEKGCIVDESLFEQWTDNIKTSTIFGRPTYTNRANTITMIVWNAAVAKNAKYSNYAKMMIGLDGSVKIYLEKLNPDISFDSNVVSGLLKPCNKILRDLVKYSESNMKLSIVKDLPVFIHSEYIYDIADYNVPKLRAILENLFTEFLILEDNTLTAGHIRSNDIQMLYLKGAGSRDKRFLQTFIKNLHKRQLSPELIQQKLKDRFLMNDEQSAIAYADWNRIYTDETLRHPRIDDDCVTITLKKATDKISVTVLGVKSVSQLHELMSTVEFMLGIYYKKQVEKQKEFPKEIKKLFSTNKTLFKERTAWASTTAFDFFDDASKKEPDINDEPIVEEEPEPEPDPESDKKDSDKDDSDFEPEPEPDPEQQSQERQAAYESGEEVVGDAQVRDEDHESDSESESDSDSEQENYRAMSSSGDSSGSQNGGGKLEEAEIDSSYPNKRYYILRLQDKDPKLISYKTASDKDNYPRRCAANQDKQPIVLTLGELNRIDKITNKTNSADKLRKHLESLSREELIEESSKLIGEKLTAKHKDKDKLDDLIQEIVLNVASYVKAYRIQGPPDRESESDDTLYYICPKYWDRKHQIPLNPRNKIHPILGTDYTDLVYSREMTDNSHYILERSGRPEGKLDRDSYWNRSSDKDDITRYNVAFIHDVHPESLALPCCGLKDMEAAYKQHKHKKSVLLPTVSALVFDESGKGTWINGRINSDIREDDTYDVIDEKGKSLGEFHISLLKQRKTTGLQGLSYGTFPLAKDKEGHVNALLKEFFHIRHADPNIANDEKHLNDNGFYRKGIQQGPNAFLSCLDKLMSYEPKRRNAKLADFIEFMKLDLKSIKDKSGLSSIGDGAFVQCFRDESFEDKSSVAESEADAVQAKARRKRETFMIQSIEQSAYDNFLKYMETKESKEPRILMSVFNAISKLPDNKCFQGLRMNLVLLEGLQSAVKVIKPYGDFTMDEELTCFIYKEGDYYEPMIYHYENKNHGFLNKTPTPEVEIQVKNDVICDYHSGPGIHQKTIAEVKKIMDDGSVEAIVKDTKEKIKIMDPKKYDISEVVNCFMEAYVKNISLIGERKTVQPDRETILKLFPEEEYEKSQNEYKDAYCRVTHLEFKKGRKDLVVPIDPEPISIFQRGESDPVQLHNTFEDMPSLSLKDAIDIVNTLELDDSSSQVLVDSNNMTRALLIDTGLYIPLNPEKYTTKKQAEYKLQKTSNQSLYDVAMLPLRKKNISTAFSDEIGKLRNVKESRLSKFSEVYARIRNDPKEIVAVLNDPIRIKMKKRTLLLGLLQKYSDIFGEEKEMKYFIEYLLNHGLENLNRILVHTFISFSDLKIPKLDTEGKQVEFIVTQREIQRENHKIYFLKKSEYLRNISLHGDIGAVASDRLSMKTVKKELTRNVSFYTKYPNQLNRIFGSNMHVYKHFVESEDSDLSVISYAMNQLSEEEFNHDKLAASLEKKLSEDPEVYKGYVEQYSNNQQVLARISDHNYQVEILDLKMLSEIYKVGFCLYTNRYSRDVKSYELFVIFHEDLHKSDTDIKDLKILCFYQHHDEKESGNKELKNIIINDSAIVPLKQLVENTFFQRALSRDE